MFLVLQRNKLNAAVPQRAVGNIKFQHVEFFYDDERKILKYVVTMDNNRKNQETTTNFGEVMKNAGVQTHPQHIKKMSEDARLMILRCDSNGFILASKKLLEDMKFQWPRTPDEVKEISFSTGRMVTSGA